MGAWPYNLVVCMYIKLDTHAVFTNGETNLNWNCLHLGSYTGKH